MTIHEPAAPLVAIVSGTGYSMGIGGDRLHRHSPAMTLAKLTVQSADAALKPFGLRVTAYSSTKFLVWKGDQSQCKRREEVSELIKAHQAFAT